MDIRLIEKYNVPIPRYTSYPTVPHWSGEVPEQSEWLSHIQSTYRDDQQLSLYIHLPFCEALCTYCGCNKRITKNHKVEAPYVDAVLAEWRIYRDSFEAKPVLKELHLGGGTPTFFAPSELERLLSAILEDCEVSDEYEFSFEAHPSTTTLEHLMTLYRLGFRRISLGVQDISADILKAINRQQSTEQVEWLTKTARKVGYQSVNYDIIYGLPFQGESNIMDTVEFLTRMRPDRVAFYSYAHVPWKSASQRAFTIDDVPTGRAKASLYQLGRQMMMDHGYHPVGMDHFCLETDDLYQAYVGDTMHRNFMGYTARYTSCNIALGASSIGDSWTAYAQNEKKVEDYQRIVGEGRLPLIKGHVLTAEEQLYRQVILYLMCRDEVVWSVDSPLVDQLMDCQGALEPLAQDGLIEYDDNHIKVIGDGKYFIRNICAAIDPILKRATTEKRTFSQAI